MLDLIRKRAQSWGVKIAFGIIIIVFVFWGVGNMHSAGPRVVATVNGKPITVQEFYEQVEARQKQVRAAVPDFSEEDMRSLRIPEQTLQMLISRSLLAQEAQRIGMKVTPVELLAYFSTFPEFRGPEGFFDQALYEGVLRREGRNVASFEQGVMGDLLGQKMQEHVTSAVSITPGEAKRRFAFQAERRVISYVLFPVEEYFANITVTDDALKSYYDANQSRFANPATTAVAFIEASPHALAASMEVTEAEITEAYNKGPANYNLRQILVALPANADAEAEKTARAKLEGFAKTLREGKNFADVVAEVSKEASAAAGEIGWTEAKGLPEELLGALSGLRKNDVTAPVRMGDRISVFQLLGTDPDYTRPEAEVKAAIKAQLAEDKAALRLREVQIKVEDMVAEGKTLADIAGELKLSTATTKAVPHGELPSLLGLRKAAQAETIAGPKGTLVSAILETASGFIVAEIAEQNPAGITPFEDVKETIRDILTRREAESMAEEAARAAVGKFGQDDNPLKDKLVTSEPFGRGGEIPVIGFSPALAEAVFSSPVGAWLQTPFATPKGAVIAMPTESIPLSDADWAQVQDRVTRGLLDSKKSQIFTAFVAALGEQGDVRITNPQILEQLR